ncbi:hypothetical protein ACKWTF_014842 [Chironomus riparius]
MTVVVGLNALIILIKIVVSAVTSSDPGNITAMYMWFPAYLQDSLVFLASYISVVLLLYSICNLAAPELIFITSAYLAASFDRLGDKVKDVIEGTEKQTFLETKRKLAECVDIHSELIELADESNKLYGPFNLIFLFVVKLSICLLGIMTMISEFIIAVQLTIGLLFTFLEISVFCMVRDQLEDKSMKIAKVIQDSNFYKIDPKLKKSLILMIQVSNRPKRISALGFFNFNWNSCSYIAQRTYSYLTILRRILSL